MCIHTAQVAWLIVYHQCQYCQYQHIVFHHASMKSWNCTLTKRLDSHCHVLKWSAPYIVWTIPYGCWCWMLMCGFPGCGYLLWAAVYTVARWRPSYIIYSDVCLSKIIRRDICSNLFSPAITYKSSNATVLFRLTLFV